MKTFLLFALCGMFCSCATIHTDNDIRDRLADSHPPSAGFVPNAQTAVRIAETVWTPIYGRQAVISQRPNMAQLCGNIWFVYGTLHSPLPSQLTIGGTLEAFIEKKTGKVLGVIEGE